MPGWAVPAAIRSARACSTARLTLRRSSRGTVGRHSVPCQHFGGGTQYGVSSIALARRRGLPVPTTGGRQYQPVVRGQAGQTTTDFIQAAHQFGPEIFLGLLYRPACCGGRARSAAVPKPSGAVCPDRQRAPRLEVSRIMVLEKSACRPWASVKAAILQDLQQQILNVAVCLFNLVKQHHAVWAAAHGLGQLAALLVADIARRRAHAAGRQCAAPYIRDMSKRSRAFSLPNQHLASVRASCVLPTPVGPKNSMAPMGRPLSRRPVRLRRMAAATAATARGLADDLGGEALFQLVQPLPLGLAYPLGRARRWPC